MEKLPPLPQLVRAEHRLFWTTRAGCELPDGVEVLKGFFTRYAENYQRLFPWRKKGTTAFELLTAELLLVQTKAEDVAKVWPIVIARYPSPARLMRAQTRSLTRLLEPLGLQNQRVRALKRLSQAIIEHFGGNVPQSIPELLTLPYVGLYVACAVACFGYGQCVPIVDSNVLRVFSRFTGIESGRELRRSPKAWRIAWTVLPKKNFVLHNYGLLDFAAEVCRAKAPLCSSCSLNTACAYARTTAKLAIGGQAYAESKGVCSI